VEKYSLKALKDVGKISDDGILVLNVSDKKVGYCNRSMAKILGKTVNEVTEMDSEQLRGTISDDDYYVTESFNQLKDRGRISNREFRLGSDPEKYLSVDAYWIAARDIIIAFIKDVTNTKQHLNYIVEFGARKDTILDMVSHNLSGPLNMTNNLLDVIDQLHKTQEYRKIDNPARLIRENTQQCIDVIHSFLKEEHFESPKIHLESNRFDVIAKVEIMVERYKQFAVEKQIKIVSGNKELFVSIDDVKFFQVVNNLISNAVKFTDAKGNIQVVVIEQESRFQVSVKDNGIGIPDYLWPHLFKKNTPAGRSGLRGEKSIGMGLYIVKKLVDIMHGSLTFESEEGKGSTFTVDLPKA
jgi:two-component system, OmpR family, sensor histidine kinase VicK